MTSNDLKTDQQLFCLVVALLSDDEVRVRQSAGDLLGSFCAKFGPAVFEAARPQVLDLIRSTLERSDATDRHQMDLVRVSTLLKSELWHTMRLHQMWKERLTLAWAKSFARGTFNGLKRKNAKKIAKNCS